MRHLYRGRKLKRTASHRKALLNSLATSLFEHKRIVTTLAKAKELRPFAESLITRAKHAMANEKQGLLTAGQTVDVHNRRMVGRFIKNKAVLQELFDAIAPVVGDRQGGYTRIVKIGIRRGDAGETAIIELVDYSAPQDGHASKTKKRKPVAKKAAPKAKATPKVEEVVAAAPIVEEVIEAPIVEEVIETIEEAPVAEVVEETQAPVEEAPAPVEETPVAETPAEDAPAAEGDAPAEN